MYPLCFLISSYRERIRCTFNNRCFADEEASNAEVKVSYEMKDNRKEEIILYKSFIIQHLFLVAIQKYPYVVHKLPKIKTALQICEQFSNSSLSIVWQQHFCLRNADCLQMPVIDYEQRSYNHFFLISIQP